MNPRFEQLGIAISQALGARANPKLIAALGELVHAILKLADLIIEDDKATAVAAAASAAIATDPQAPTEPSAVTLPVATGQAAASEAAVNLSPVASTAPLDTGIPALAVHGVTPTSQ